MKRQQGRVLGLALAVLGAQSVWAANELFVQTNISNPSDGDINIKIEKGRQGMLVSIGGGHAPLNIDTAMITLTGAGTCANNVLIPAASQCSAILNATKDAITVYFNGNFPLNTTLVLQVAGVTGSGGATQDPGSANTITFTTKAMETPRPLTSIQNVFDISGSMGNPTVPMGPLRRIDALHHAAQALYMLLGDHAMLGDKVGSMFF